MSLCQFVLIVSLLLRFMIGGNREGLAPGFTVRSTPGEKTSCRVARTSFVATT